MKEASLMNPVPVLPSIPLSGARPKRARRVFRHLGRLAVVVGTIALPARLDTVTEHRVIGYMLIDHPRIDGPQPQIPDTATAMVPLEISIWTALSGCYRGGDTEVVVKGRSAVVTPYDYLRTGGGACPTYLEFFEHKATVVFGEPGTVEVVLVYSTDGHYSPENHKGDGRKVYTVEVLPADADVSQQHRPGAI